MSVLPATVTLLQDLGLRGAEGNQKNTYIKLSSYQKGCTNLTLILVQS